jgi:hypothetical protein
MRRGSMLLSVARTLITPNPENVSLADLLAAQKAGNQGDLSSVHGDHYASDWEHGKTR